MITIDNLNEYYGQINMLKDLPNELVFDFPYIDLYNDDEQIKEYIDTYLLRVNEFLRKNDYCFMNGELIKSSIKIPKEFTPVTDIPKYNPKPEPKTAKQAKTVKEKAAKVVKSKSKYKEGLRLWHFDNKETIIEEQIKNIIHDTTGEVVYHVYGGQRHSYFESEITKGLKEKTLFLKYPSRPIEKLPVDVYFIKRYIGMNGKIKTGDQILNLLHALQKALTERTINKDSLYSKEIMQIQNELIKCVEMVNTSATIEIDAKRLEHYRSIVNQYQPMLSVTYLKKYISLNGKSGIKGKAQELAKLIKKAVDTNRIPKTDRYARQIETAYNNLISFSDNTFVIEQAELNGLQGLDGLGESEGLGFITPLITGVAANVIANHINKGIEESKGKVVNSTELAGMEFETLPLDGDYKKIIGIPSKNFSAMIHGKPGSGKTTWCITFAKYLAEKQNLKVLFATIEEGINHTAQEKLKRLRAAHSNLSIADHMPDNLSAYDVVFVDSINSFRYSPQDLQALKQKYPNVIFIEVFQSTKDGKFKGSQEYEHDVDVVIKAENGTISTIGSKNRFGVGEEVRVW